MSRKRARICARNVGKEFKMDILTSKHIPDVVELIFQYLDFNARKSLSLASPDLLRFARQSKSFLLQDEKYEDSIREFMALVDQPWLRYETLGAFLTKNHHSDLVKKYESGKSYTKRYRRLLALLKRHGQLAIESFVAKQSVENFLQTYFATYRSCVTQMHVILYEEGLSLTASKCVDMNQAVENLRMIKRHCDLFPDFRSACRRHGYYSQS